MIGSSPSGPPRTSIAASRSAALRASGPTTGIEDGGTIKPGGGGIIAQTHLNQRPGDAHYLEITATSLLTNHITGKSTFSHRDFTPVSMLSDEYIGFLVRADSPLKTGRDLLAALKADIESVPIGIATAAGNTNHIAAGLAAKSAGADVRDDLEPRADVGETKAFQRSRDVQILAPGFATQWR